MQGNRICAVATDLGSIDAIGAQVIDAADMTLMPGMVEGQSHLTFTGVNHPAELGGIPPEEHLILAIQKTRLMLDHGLASLFEAAAAKNIGRPELRLVHRENFQQHPRCGQHNRHGKQRPGEQG